MSRALLVVLFVLLLATVVVGGHLYLARRLVLDPAFGGTARTVGLAALVALAATLVLHPIAERTVPPRAARVVAWASSLWMGVAFLLLMLLVATDMAAFVLGAFADATGSITAARVRAIGVLAVGLTAGAVGVRGALRGPRVRRVELRLPRWPTGLDGFRIVQVSDVHIGPILDRRFARRVVERCNALVPDLVAITGDLVDGSVARLADEVAPFAELRARHGVWFVTGNHDYYSGASAWAAHVATLGIGVLRNACVPIGTDAGSFDLAGVEDHHAHLVSATHREDVPGALAGRDPTRPVVLLAHDPATFPTAARHGVDLQLSGHTHGGQIWPFAWFVRLATPFVAGVHRRGDAWLYVSRGTGFWGPAMRLRAPAEITEIVLHAPAALSSDCARA